jgi:cyclopropane fatty-acyl-phospholipid synthase-like methyltransferase
MSETRSQIAEYYGRVFAAHGDTPRGMDWNSEEAQMLRFDKLLQHLPVEGASMLDVGCGTGELYGLIRERRLGLAAYHGIDFVEPMVETARRKFPDEGKATFSVGGLESLGDRRFDLVVASGIFNVKQEVSAASWEAHVRDTLRAMYERADRAVAFNVLTGFSDPDRRAAHLYYADPGSLMAFCRAELSRFMLVDHGYKFFEFTAVVYRNPE